MLAEPGDDRCTCGCCVDCCLCCSLLLLAVILFSSSFCCCRFCCSVHAVAVDVAFLIFWVFLVLSLFAFIIFPVVSPHIHHRRCGRDPNGARKALSCPGAARLHEVVALSFICCCRLLLYFYCWTFFAVWRKSQKKFARSCRSSTLH